jgi:transcriptional regulator with XRE-family HTH domain
MHFFGSEVRRAREAAGMTQADLGACPVRQLHRVAGQGGHPGT